MGRKWCPSTCQLVAERFFHLIGVEGTTLLSGHDLHILQSLGNRLLDGPYGV
jgi:hypothetical protein